MASVIISGDTSGTATLQAQAVAGNTVLTLPTTNGTLITTASGQTLTSPTITSPTISGAVMSSMASSVITSATAQATTSGTSVDFTGIPSWAKRVTVMLNEVDVASTDEVVILLGTSSSFETTGYISTFYSGVTYYDSTTSFRIAEPQVALSGSITFINISGNTWIASGAGKTGTSRIFAGGGSKTLASALTRVQIKSSISAAFTSGSINILYE